MLDKRITRKEFLKVSFLSSLALLVMPVFRIFKTRDKEPYKEASYYKDLAG